MKERLIGALIIAIICIPITIIGGSVFSVAMGMIGILALKELLDLKESHLKIPPIITLISFIDLLLLIFSDFGGYSIAFGLTYRGIAITFLTLFLPCLFIKDKYSTKEAMYLFGCVIFIGLIFNSFILVRNYDIYHLLYIAFISIFTDIFAFIIGTVFGKHHCAKTISKNKTWEGSIGGAICGTIISSIFYIVVINNINIFKVVGITLVLSIMGELGDLVFSKIKRENKIKDFSNLIYGHGGILDRIDSLIIILLTYIILFGII